MNDTNGDISRHGLIAEESKHFPDKQPGASHQDSFQMSNIYGVSDIEACPNMPRTIQTIDTVKSKPGSKIRSAKLTSV